MVVIKTSELDRLASEWLAACKEGKIDPVKDEDFSFLDYLEDNGYSGILANGTTIFAINPYEVYEAQQRELLKEDAVTAVEIYVLGTSEDCLSDEEIEEGKEIFLEDRGISYEELMADEVIERIVSIYLDKASREIAVELTMNDAVNLVVGDLLRQKRNQ